MSSYFVLSENTIPEKYHTMSTFPVFVNLLKDYNRYKVEIFSVYSTFNKLSNGISFVIVAQNFITSTCLSMSTKCDFAQKSCFRLRRQK